MTSFWGVALKWCIGVPPPLQRWRREARRIFQMKLKEKEKERKHGEIYSGEIWETVQDFHYLWCKWSDPIIRRLISSALISSPFFPLSPCDQWSTVCGGEGCRSPRMVFVPLEAHGMALCPVVYFKINPAKKSTHRTYALNLEAGAARNEKSGFISVAVLHSFKHVVPKNKWHRV